jgi:hypothetical protein
MDRHYLRTTEPMHPHWLNGVVGAPHNCIVTKEQTVVLNGVALRFRETPLSEGTPIKVWLGTSGFFICATLDAIERDKQEQKARDAAFAQQRALKLEALREEAIQFNARIRLPVKWGTGIKDVLSGLSEGSNGDGRKRSTVEHIYLLEHLVQGAFRRAPGDFLCTSSKGTNGRQWSASPLEHRMDDTGTGYAPKVTCRACLKAAQRWAITE